MQNAKKKLHQLPEPEECGEGFNYCGGDEDKYPLDDIEAILNNTLELKLSSTTMHRFFKPAAIQQIQEVQEAGSVNSSAEIRISAPQGNSLMGMDNQIVKTLGDFILFTDVFFSLILTKFITI